MGSAGDQEKESMARRFFQGLEQRIGGTDGQSIGLVNETDLPFADERPIDELLFDLSDLLDLDLRRRRFRIGLDHETVRVCPSRDLYASATVPAAVDIVRVARLLTVQCLGQPHSGHPFSDPSLTVEEVGVGQAPVAHACLEQGDGLFVTGDISEGHGS